MCRFKKIASLSIFGFNFEFEYKLTQACSESILISVRETFQREKQGLYREAIKPSKSALN